MLSAGILSSATLKLWGGLKLTVSVDRKDKIWGRGMFKFALQVFVYLSSCRLCGLSSLGAFPQLPAPAGVAPMDRSLSRRMLAHLGYPFLQTCQPHPHCLWEKFPVPC